MHNPEGPLKTRSTTRSRGSIGELAGVGVRCEKVREDVEISELKDLEPIGQGEYASVYSARWKGMSEQKVAVKILKKEHLGKEGPADDMRSEAQILSKLNSNPGIVNIYGSGTTADGRPFFLMEKLSGQTLEPRIHGTHDYLKRLQMCISLARIFDSLHRGGATEGLKVLHRDLKPANIGITRDTKELKLLDFGLVRLLYNENERITKVPTDGSFPKPPSSSSSVPPLPPVTPTRKGRKNAFPKSRTMSGDVLFDITGNTGSLRFMAPEVALHKHYNHKCEVYSFGVMMYQIIEQRLPYRGKTPRKMMEEVFAGEHWRERLNSAYWPHGLDKILERCWHHDIDARPEFSEVIEKLHEVAEAVEEARIERGTGCMSCFVSFG
eukprot:CAMPEP_0118649256 /NCGR_PEP_ID=MMETSP0785-20121206/9607_1 /TAXON_ID=91992 /ORGANISM="Bolidomonas pacifica, Strain CCMP 1866" /LENGTH=380 /DNA_ID=CAMNT_0006541533 /DNA_START=232 /DNA_END=1371 /DNA_ORIENTATION=+